MLGDVRVEGTLGHELQERRERPGRDTLAPILLADPVADEADTVRGQLPMLPATWPSTTIVWLIAAGLPRMFVAQWASKAARSRAGKAAMRVASASSCCS